jgi:hypothetical protein
MNIDGYCAARISLPCQINMPDFWQYRRGLLRQNWTRYEKTEAKKKVMMLQK